MRKPQLQKFMQTERLKSLVENGIKPPSLKVSVYRLNSEYKKLESELNKRVKK